MHLIRFDCPSVHQRLIQIENAPTLTFSGFRSGNCSLSAISLSTPSESWREGAPRSRRLGTSKFEWRGWEVGWNTWFKEYHQAFFWLFVFLFCWTVRRNWKMHLMGKIVLRFFRDNVQCDPSFCQVDVRDVASLAEVSLQMWCDCLGNEGAMGCMNVHFCQLKMPSTVKNSNY